MKKQNKIKDKEICHYRVFQKGNGIRMIAVNSYLKQAAEKLDTHFIDVILQNKAVK